jgi:hypothetical protein
MVLALVAPSALSKITVICGIVADLPAQPYPLRKSIVGAVPLENGMKMSSINRMWFFWLDRRHLQWPSERVRNCSRNCAVEFGINSPLPQSRITA